MFSRQSSNGIWAQRAVGALVLTAAVAWVYLTSTNWITSSEFWPITLAGHWDQWRDHPSLLYKAFFHATLSWIYLLDLDSVQHLRVARFFYAILGLIFFFLFYRLCRKFINARQAFLTILLFAMSLTGFSQIGLIRSDFLSSLLALVALLVYFNEKVPKVHKILLLGFVSLLMLFSTPKSVLIIVAFLPVIILENRHFFSFRRLNIFLVIMTVLSVLFWILDYSLDQKLAMALGDAFHHNLEAQAVAKTQTLHYKFVEWYLLHDGLLFAGLILLVVKQLWSGFANRVFRDLGFALFGLGILLIFLLHEPKLPFFLGSLFPLLIFSALPSLAKIPTRGIAVLGLIFGLSTIALGRFPYYHDSYEPQLQVVEILERILNEHPGMSHFDGVQLLPRAQNSKLIFVGPFDSWANLYAMEALEKKPPDLLVYTPRVQNLEPRFSIFMLKLYQAKGPGYWIRKGHPFQESLENMPLSLVYFGYLSPRQSATWSE